MVNETVEFYFCEMRGDTFKSATIPDLRVEALSSDVLVAYEMWKVAHDLE